jgi:hypothetical protein
MEFPLSVAQGAVNESGCSEEGTPAPFCLATTGAVRLLDHPHGEGVRRDFSRLHPGRTGGSFEYAHALSHMRWVGQG